MQMFVKSQILMEVRVCIQQKHINTEFLKRERNRHTCIYGQLRSGFQFALYGFKELLNIERMWLRCMAEGCRFGMRHNSTSDIFEIA